MAEPVAYGLIGDPSLTRAAMIPVARPTFTDPGDDITEELGGLELATPGLLYDPLMGMAQTGAMLMGDMPVDPNVMTQTMLDAPLVGGLLGAATGAAPKGALLGANVFHGGPHRFAAEPDFPHGRPRLDKVGTGEGAQAYGYGFYSADAPGVATDYKVRLADRTGNQTLEDNTKIPSWVANKVNAGQADEVRQDFLGRIAEAERKVAAKEGQYWLEESKIKGLQEVVSAIDKMVGGQTASGGTLYKLDIPDADVAKYLDYDKPLSQQAPYVKQRVEKLIDDIGGDFANEFSHPQTRVTTTGERLYNLLQRRLGLSDKEASEALREAGIPGLKYFDGMSRDGGEGTRNYVTWDQDVLDRSKMLERDGVTLGANKGPTAALPGLFDDVTGRAKARSGPLLSKEQYDDAKAFYHAGRKTKKRLRREWDYDEDRIAAAKENAGLLGDVYETRGEQGLRAKDRIDPLIVQSRLRQGRLNEARRQDRIDEFMRSNNIDDRFRPNIYSYDTEPTILAKFDRAKRNSDQLLLIQESPGRLDWNKKFLEEINKAARSPDLFSVEDAINRANMEAVPRLLKKEGWTVRHGSKDRSGRKSSRYLVSPDKKFEVRLSDHDLPDTPARSHNREQFGGPRWNDEIILTGRDNPRDVIDEVRRLYSEGIELGANKAPTAALPGLLQDRRGNIDQRSLLSRTPRKRDEFPIFGLLGQRLYTATAPDGSI